MKLPRISVVMPSFNHNDFLEQALVSVIGQQYPDLEIIVMDGGSKDGSIDTIRKHAEHIAYWESEPDKGQTDAINRGFRKSSGDVLCWLNSDDLLMPGTLIDVGRRFTESPDKARLIHGSGIVWHDSASSQQADVIHATRHESSELRRFNYMVQPSCYWSRSLYERTGPLDMDYDYVMDWDWFLRASEHAEFEFVSKPYSIFRMHETNKTANGGATRRAEILNVVDRFADDYWKRLYRYVDENYERIKPKYDRMTGWRLPRSRQLFLWMHPILKRRVRHGDDLVAVMEMFN
jgi:glycosyltransferase involved in cell wall biosynthesis